MRKALLLLLLLPSLALAHGRNGVEVPTDCAQYSVLGRVASGTGVLACEAATGTGSPVRASSPTLTTPTIADLTNAQHDHLDADDGSVLTGYVAYSSAVCDDSTDDRATIQAEIDALNAGVAGGTLILPPRKCIIGGVGLAMKSAVRIEGFGTATLKAKSDISDEIIDGGTLNNWRINGVRFDLNSVAKGAVDFTSGINWQFTNNSVLGTPTSSQSEWHLVALGCSTGSYGQCIIQGNRITGSETDATNDNCLKVTGGSGGFAGQGYLIAENDISGCGKDGILLDATGYQVASNNIDDIEFGYGINASSSDNTANGSILGNQIGVDTSTGLACIVTRHDNTEISGNHCGANADAWSIIAIAGPVATGVNMAGVKVSDNYAADGIWFKSISTCTGGAQGECHVTADCTGASSGTCDATKYGRFDHNLILGNVTARPGTAPNGGDDIRVENQMSLVIGDNTILGSKTTVDSAGIYVLNTRSDVTSGSVVIGHNTIGIYDSDSGGQASCVIFNDSGGGGFDEYVVDANTCGRQEYAASSGPPSNFVKVVNAPAPWTDMSFSNNVAAQPGTFISSDPGSTAYCGNVGKADTCGGNSTLVAVKTADEVLNNVGVVQDDDHLSVSLSANGTYLVDGVFLLAQASGTAADFRFNFVEQSGTTYRIGFQATAGGDFGHLLESDTDSGKVNLTANSEQAVFIAGTVFVSSTGGTFKLQWSQDVATAVNSTMFKGSWLTFTKTN